MFQKIILDHTFSKFSLKKFVHKKIKFYSIKKNELKKNLQKFKKYTRPVKKINYSHYLCILDHIRMHTISVKSKGK